MEDKTSISIACRWFHTLLLKGLMKHFPFLHFVKKKMKKNQIAASAGSILPLTMKLQVVQLFSMRVKNKEHLTLSCTRLDKVKRTNRPIKQQMLRSYNLKLFFVNYTPLCLSVRLSVGWPVGLLVTLLLFFINFISSSHLKSFKSIPSHSKPF